MNVRQGPVSGAGASTFARWLGWTALALTLARAQAEDTPKPQEPLPRAVPRAVPRLLIQPQFPQPSAIRWRNGETLAGKLVEIGEAGFTWSSELFKSPLLLRRESLDRIDFNAPILKREASFRVILTDGSQLSGTPEKLENGILFLRSTHSGLVELKQENLAAFERIGGGGVITGGPQALLVRDSPAASEFVPTTPAIAASKPLWYFTAAGQLASNTFRQGITLPWKLPDKSSVGLLLNCDRQPEFSLKLTADEGSCAVETWGDELVLTDGEEFASAGTVIQSGKGRALLRIAWDRPAGRRVLYSDGGKVLAEMTVPPAPKSAPVRKKKKAVSGTLAGALKLLLGRNGAERNPDAQPPAAPAANGVTFQNKGAAVVLEQFSLSEWNGEPLPALLAGQTGLETSGEAVPGELAGISADTLTLRAADGQTRDFPMAAVRAFRWNRAVKMEQDASLTDLWFADGDLLRGRLTGAKEGTATMEISASAQAVNSKWKGGRALMLPLTDKKEDPLRPLEKMDLVSSGLSSGPGPLHGIILAESEGPLPQFSPIGAVVPVELSPSPDLVLTWAKPATESAPALLYVEGGETLPVKTAGLERGTIQLPWENAGGGELDPMLIQAVQFAVPSVIQGGFGDAGWHLLGTGKDPPPRAEKDGEITLTPGTGIAHPFLLQGGGLSFRMSVVSGLASIRVKLFSQGADRSSGGVNFLIADYGSTVYAGIERDEGQINNQQNTPSTGGGTEVRCAFEGGVAEMFVNGVSIGRAKPDIRNGKKSGHGLIIETASLWGNQMGSVKLSDFSCETPAFQVPPPAFTEEAKREALRLPRLRRDDPPKQVLIGRNGDLLRGEIEAMTSTHLAFRSGLEHFNVPIDRVAAAVWVKKPLPADKAMGKNHHGNGKQGDQPTDGTETPPAGDPKPSPPDGRQWLDLTNGGRLALTIISWNQKEVTAKHPLMGECRIPTSSLGSLRLATPLPGIARSVLSDWTLETTPDPVLDSDGGDSSLQGKDAPDFKLALLEGGDFALKKYQGKVVVLDFWATWCGPCVKSLPALVETMGEFPQEQAVFLSVNQAETKEQISHFLEARRLTMAVALDADQSLASKYGVEGIPHTVVIGPDGKIAFVKTGYSPDGEKQIAGAVRQALGLKASDSPEKSEDAGEKPTPVVTPED